VAPSAATGGGAAGAGPASAGGAAPQVTAMPEFARNLFHARLETILDDAKTRFPTGAETSIDLVDASSGQTMEHVMH